MRFSVVVPTHRRPQALADCLQSLSGLNYPSAQFEVIVVDDASDYEVADVVSRFEGPIDVRLIALRANGGPANARTVGAMAARGDIIAFIDDDCTADRDWLLALDSAFPAAPGLLAIGGHTINHHQSNIYSTASHYLLDFLFEWYNGDPRSARFFPSLNLACGRTAFGEMGGFDPAFPLAAAEDRDFCDRWREAGGSLAYEERAVVRHGHRLDLFRFIRQHFSYGRGAVYLHAARAARGAERPKLEPLQFYRRLVLYPWRRENRARTPLLVLLAGLSQVTYGLGYYLERLRKPRLRNELTARSRVRPRAAALVNSRTKVAS
jgi:GT2 family glycosyltransferase